MRICIEWLSEFLGKEIFVESIVEELTKNGYEVCITENNTIDVELTVNRLDCFSLFGFSREVNIVRKKKL